MRWDGPERVNRKPEKPEPCGVSYEEHQADIEARRNALSTPMSAKTGYASEPIDPESTLYRKKWTDE